MASDSTVDSKAYAHSTVYQSIVVEKCTVIVVFART